MNPSADDPKVQGEGDYESARRYRESVESFTKSGKVDEAARNAAPGSEAEEKELERAERVGESRSKGEDPASPHSPPRQP
jgi:hypothetical protein